MHFVPVVKLFGDLDGNVRVIVCFAFFIRYDVVYGWCSFISISRIFFSVHRMFTKINKNDENRDRSICFVSV
jgi:hypothetical protein